MCFSPVYVKHDKQAINVPCGRCPECYDKRAQQWTIRLMHENKYAHSSHFVTLTYDDSELTRSYNGWQTLNNIDLQQFFKRLRWYETGNNKSLIKYYAVGEYGEHTLRPHYHALIFNIFEPLNIYRAWNKGITHVGDITVQSAQYVAGYWNYRLGIPTCDYDDREKEKSLMSKGLGKDYMYHYLSTLNKSSPSYLQWHGKHKYSWPRYYKEFLNDNTKKDINEELTNYYNQVQNKQIIASGDYQTWYNNRKQYILLNSTRRERPEIIC